MYPLDTYSSPADHLDRRDWLSRERLRKENARRRVRAPEGAQLLPQDVSPPRRVRDFRREGADTACCFSMCSFKAFYRVERVLP